LDGSDIQVTVKPIIPWQSDKSSNNSQPRGLQVVGEYYEPRVELICLDGPVDIVRGFFLRQ